MADFCKQHSMQMWGTNTKDLANLCNPDEVIRVLCEGCGEYVHVDYNGNKMIWDEQFLEWVIDKNVRPL